MAAFLLGPNLATTSLDVRVLDTIDMNNLTDELTNHIPINTMNETTMNIVLFNGLIMHC